MVHAKHLMIPGVVQMSGVAYRLPSCCCIDCCVANKNKCCPCPLCRICWAAFASEGFQIRTYSYQILQYYPNYGTQITPVTPVGIITSTIVTGLQLEEEHTYFIKVVA